MLRTLVIGFFAFLAALLVTTAILLALLSYTLHRRNRIVPDVETAAPLVWLWSPSASARLHRRIRATAGTVHVPEKRGSRAEADRHVTMCRTLVAEAVEIDRHLILAARLPGARRRQALRLLEGQVTQLEHLALRLNRMRRSLVPGLALDGTVTPGDTLAELAYELDLLDEAHEELLAIEQANGLLDPTPLLNRADLTAPVTEARPAPPSVGHQPPQPTALPQHSSATTATPVPQPPPAVPTPAAGQPPPPTGRPLTHLPPPAS